MKIADKYPVDGEMLTIAQMEERCNVPYATLYVRMKHDNLSPKEAMRSGDRRKLRSPVNMPSSGESVGKLTVGQRSELSKMRVEGLADELIRDRYKERDEECLRKRNGK